MFLFGSRTKTTMVSEQDALPGRDARPYAVPARHAVLGTPLEGPWPAGTQVLYVAMGCCGAATSLDGLTWHREQGGVNGGVAFVNGLFVGAGWYASISVSPDGKTWTGVYDGQGPNQFDATKNAPWFTAVGAGMTLH